MDYLKSTDIKARANYQSTEAVGYELRTSSGAATVVSTVLGGTGGLVIIVAVMCSVRRPARLFDDCPERTSSVSLCLDFRRASSAARLFI